MKLHPFVKFARLTALASAIAIGVTAVTVSAAPRPADALAAPDRSDPPPQLGLAASDAAPDPSGRPSQVLGARCPEGTFLSPFEKPIYDDDGLFVVGYETVWYCLRDDLEPAG